MHYDTGSNTHCFGKKSVSTIILLCVFFISSVVSAQKLDTGSPIDTETVKFIKSYLHFESGGTTTKVRVPHISYIGTPLNMSMIGLDTYVDSSDYDENVTAFRLHDNLTGLHLSSYAIQKEGSAQAAAGRDVFLIYDSGKKKLYKGLNLGITKGRVRAMGCYFAEYGNFLISDINQDSLMDIGVIREELECKEVQKEDIDGIEGPFYVQHPVKWYVFNENRWKYDKNLDGKMMQDSTWELPLIGIEKSPIDYIGFAEWKTYDSSKWPSESTEPVQYIPLYRKKLIEDNVKEHPEQLQLYKIKRGDTLWRIAAKRYGNRHYEKILALYNGIDDPTKLIAGSVIRTPDLKTILVDEGLCLTVCEEIEHILIARSYFMKLSDRFWVVKSKARRVSSSIIVPPEIRDELRFIKSHIDRAINGFSSSKEGVKERPLKLIHQLRKLSDLLGELMRGNQLEWRYYGLDMVHQRMVYAMVNGIQWARNDFE